MRLKSIIFEIANAAKIDNLKRNIQHLIAPREVSISVSSNDQYMTAIILANGLSPLQKIDRYFKKAEKQGVKSTISGKKLILQMPIHFFE